MFDIGYACGALCADGCLQFDKGHGHYRICLEAKEREFVDLFQRRLSPYVQREVKIYETKNKKYRGLPYKTFIASVYGKKVISDFRNKWGIKTGSYSWEVPKIAFTDAEFRRGFLQGFFDGEGTVRVRLRLIRSKKGSAHVEKRRNARITSVNLSSLWHIGLLLKMEGIPWIVYRAGKYWCLDIDGKSRLIAFMEKIGFGLKSKMKKLENAIAPSALT